MNKNWNIQYMQNPTTPIKYVTSMRDIGALLHGHWGVEGVGGVGGKRYSYQLPRHFYTNPDGTIRFDGLNYTIQTDKLGNKYIDVDAKQPYNIGSTYIYGKGYRQGTTYYRIPIAGTKEYVEPEPNVIQQELEIINPKVITSKRTISLNSLTKTNRILQTYSKIPQSVSLYLDHVNKNGLPFFKLPKGISDIDFDIALQQFYQNNPEAKQLSIPKYEPTESKKVVTKQPESINNSEQADSNKSALSKTLNITKSNSIKQGNVNSVYANKKFSIYAYPSKEIDLYNIHPEIYELIIASLSPSNNLNSKWRGYYLSPKPLSKIPIGSNMNDTVYHYIGKYGEDLTLIKPANRNGYLLGEGDIITKNTEYIPQKYIDKGIVSAYTINDPGSYAAIGYTVTDNKDLLGITINTNEKASFPVNYIYSDRDPYYAPEASGYKVDPSSSIFDELFESTNIRNVTRELWNNYVEHNNRYALFNPSHLDAFLNNVPKENFEENDSKPIEQRSQFVLAAATTPKILSEPFKKVINGITGLFRKKKFGGVVNYLDYFKNGGKSGIHIKKSHEGSFTKYCNGKVTEECIRRGKNSPSAKIRKQATFAANARTWKHQTGGELIKSNSTFFDKAKNAITETPINYLSFYSPIHIDYSNYKNIKTPEPVNLMDYIIRTQVPAPDMNYIKSVSNNNSSRGYRNNNPLNLRISNDKWMGSVENNTDGSFVQFKNMAYGFRAGLKNIQTRIKKYGNNTIESLITAWAPPSDNNDTTSYIKHVSDRVGINPKAILDPNDKEVMIKLARAIAYFENGSEANISDIEKGWNLLNE